MQNPIIIYLLKTESKNKKFNSFVNYLKKNKFKLFNKKNYKNRSKKNKFKSKNLSKINKKKLTFAYKLKKAYNSNMFFFRTISTNNVYLKLNKKNLIINNI